MVKKFAVILLFLTFNMIIKYVSITYNKNKRINFLLFYFTNIKNCVIILITNIGRENMKQYVFPAVVYQDDETGLYVLAFKDMTLVVEGESVEEVFKGAKELLKEYVKTALDFDGEVYVEPSKFIEVYKKYRTEICILVDCEI